jgi:hypothetical protein
MCAEAPGAAPVKMFHIAARAQTPEPPCSGVVYRQTVGMRDQDIKTLCKLGLAGLLTMSLPVTRAELYRVEEVNPPEAPTEPALAVFYRVGRDGESVPENPVVSGFALGSTSSYDLPSRVSEAQRPPSAMFVLAPRRPVTIRIDIPHASNKGRVNSDFDAFSCERYGFFYTSKGRCVLPPLKRRTGIPHAHPRRTDDARTN